MKNIFKYSDEGLHNRYIFYGNINGLNIFVEDYGSEYVYEAILEDLFDSKYKIISILPQNGKSSLINAFKKFGRHCVNGENKINNIYIADGDFDRYIKSKKMVDDIHFIYLECYNIESCYISKENTLKYMRGKMKKIYSEVDTEIKFDFWLDKIVQQSQKLFLLYCYIQTCYSDEKNVGTNLTFIDENEGFMLEGKYKELYDKYNSLDVEINNEINKIIDLYKKINGENFFNLICGKFLFHSLYTYLKSKSQKINHDDFKLHLINNFEVNKLKYIKDKVVAICDN